MTENGTDEVPPAVITSRTDVAKSKKKKKKKIRIIRAAFSQDDAGVRLYPRDNDDGTNENRGDLAPENRWEAGEEGEEEREDKMTDDFLLSDEESPEYEDIVYEGEFDDEGIEEDALRSTATEKSEEEARDARPDHVPDEIPAGDEVRINLSFRVIVPAELPCLTTFVIVRGLLSTLPSHYAPPHGTQRALPHCIRVPSSLSLVIAIDRNVVIKHVSL